MSERAVLELVATAQDNASGVLKQVTNSLKELNKAGVGMGVHRKEVQALTRDLNNMVGSTKGLKESGKHLAKFAEQFKVVNERLKSVSEMATKVFEPALAGVGFAAFSAGGSITSLIMAARGFGETGADLVDFAKQTGFATSKVQELDAAAGRFHMSKDEMRNSLAQIGEDFERLAKVVDGGPLMKGLPMHGMRDTAEHLRGIMRGPGDEETKKWQSFEILLGDLSKQYDRLGESATKGLLRDAGLPEGMVKLLRDGPEGLKKALEEARRLLGPAFDAKQVEEYERAVNNLKTSFSGLQNAIGTELLSDFSELNHDLSEFIAANREGIGKGVHDALETLKEDLGELKPLVQVIKDVFNAINAINDFHPGKVLREKLGLDKLFPGDPGEQAKAGREAISEAAKKGAVTPTTPVAPLPDQYKAGGSFPGQMLDQDQNLNPSVITSKDITAALGLIPEAMRSGLKDHEEDLRDSAGAITKSIGDGIKSKGSEIIDYGRWLWDALKHSISMAAEAEEFQGGGGLVTQAAYHPGGGFGSGGGGGSGRGGGFGGGGGSDFGVGGGVTPGSGVGGMLGGPGAAARSGLGAIRGATGGGIQGVAGTGAGRGGGGASGFKSDNTAIAKASIIDQLRKEGVPEEHLDAAASALTGQAISESGLNPNTSHDSGTGYGIYGARNERRAGMLNWLKENGYAANSLVGQSKYMAHEAMSKGYGPSRNALMGATNENIGGVNKTLTDNFEAPAVRNYGRRMQDTQTALGTKPDMDPAGTRAKSGSAVAPPSAAGPDIPLVGGAAERAGGIPGIPNTGSLSGMNPELRARVNALYNDAPPGVKEKMALTSGYRDPRDPRVQALWQEHLRHPTAAMANPSRSQHGRNEDQGGAVDFAHMGMGDRDPAVLDYISKNAHKYGLTGPNEAVRSESWHSQLDPSYRGKNFANSGEQPTPSQAQNQKMLFLQGIEGREKGEGHTPSDIEGHMRRLAKARGLDFGSIGGANGPAAQEREARARLKQGGISDVQGFSMGGYTANRLQRDCPGVNFDALGATKDGSDPRFPGVRHLDLPGALADKAAKEHLDTLKKNNDALLRPSAGRRGLAPGAISSPQPGELSAAATKASAVEHKVTGTGHLKVDVNAPKGTSVKASGGGMFKETKLNRSFSGARASETA